MRVRQEEQEALRLLKKHFPQYSKLTHSDKPDLINCEKSLGVEVTCAVDPKIEKQTAYFYENLKGHSKDEARLRSVSQVEKCGLDIVCIKDGEEETTERMYGLVRVFDLKEKELLHQAIRTKYTKKYQKLDSIDLYLFFRHMCRGALSEDDLKKLMQTAHDCEIEHGKVFEKIMIDFYSVLVVIDLEHNCIDEITNYGD